MSPKLIIKIDKKYDTERFCTFFYKYGSSDLQTRIIRKYEVFNKILSLDNKQLKKEIYKIVGNLYKEYAERLKEAQIKFQEASDEIFTKCIEELIITMDYTNKIPDSYIGILSLLPFSPFDIDEKTFSISILSFEKNNNPKQAIRIAIHEISHFFYQNWLKENGFEDIADYGNWINYVAKESITPVLMRNGELGKYFPNCKGNENVEQLKIDGFDGSFVDWCETIYKKHDGKFYEFASEITNTVIQFQEILSERKSHWDKAYKIGIGEDEKEIELRLFSAPIKI